MKSDTEKSHGASRREDEALDISLQHKANTSQQTRRQIACDTLERYSGSALKDFQKFILLTNFPHYVDDFATAYDAKIYSGPVLRVAHAKNIKVSIIDYRVGSPMAALVMDVLSYTSPQCVLMLGLCGGLHRSQKVGDFLLPMAAIRDEGSSRHYMPAQVPSLPAFMTQKFVAEELMERKIPFRTGVIHTTDYRMWEFDEEFRARLRGEKATAIDMECSTLFTTGFARKVPVGALMLVSDLPCKPGGVKTHKSSRKVFEKYTKLHLSCGVASIERMVMNTQEHNLNLRSFLF